MSIENLYALYQKHPIVSTDSRNLIPGSLFFALKGTNFDGNNFAEKALETCAYAIIDNPKIAKNDRYVLVNDVLKTLQQLANYHRNKLRTTLIAITGTNGKTTTKELVYSVLKQHYKTLKTEGNLNNHIGVPLTLLKLTSEHQFGVIEMGANHIGEIKQLCEICEPNYGIITNVGKAHLEGFGSFEGVIKAKGELYEYLNYRNGVAFMHSDNIYLEEMHPPKTVVYYGTGKFNHCQGTLNSNKLMLSFSWIPSNELSEKEINQIKLSESYHINTNLIGQYNLPNALAAVCVGNYFQVTPKQIKQAIETYVPENHRSQILETKNNKLVLDSYNANPSSMDAAINNFAQIDLQNKTLILGDMLELGEASLREHGVILGLIQKHNFGKVYLVGETFTTLSDFGHFNYFKSTEKLKEFLIKEPIRQSNILIKGSRGMALEQLIEVL